jgi:hypothetical protein
MQKQNGSFNLQLALQGSTRSWTAQTNRLSAFYSCAQRLSLTVPFLWAVEKSWAHDCNWKWVFEVVAGPVQSYTATQQSYTAEKWAEEKIEVWLSHYDYLASWQSF